jgi:hypothetical protein
LAGGQAPKLWRKDLPLFQVAPSIDEASAPAREKRLVLRILELWREAHDAEQLPSASALTPADTGEDADHVYLIDVLDPAGPRFTYVGAALQISTWASAEGALVGHCPDDSMLGLASRHWGEIIDRGVPVTRGGIGQHDGGPVLYRSILVPLADESGRISAIMGAANWRRVEEQDGTAVE